MPTNEERREVAARLREVRSVPEWATTACCIAELIGEYDYPLWDSSKQLFDLLADLIEPEPERTCNAEQIPYMPGCYEGNWCSVCHCIEFESDEPNYCPNCGAKVVDK